MLTRILSVFVFCALFAGPARAAPALLAPETPGIPGFGTPALVLAPELRLALLVRAPVGDDVDPGENEFDLFGDTARQQADLADPGLEKELRKRRSMLKTHQILGLTTLGLMAATAVVGQLNYNNTYGSDPSGNGDLRVPHMVSSYATAAAFATTAAYSLFAPDPIERESGGLDTATLHKIAVIGASAGMLAQAGLGFVSARSADAGHPDRPGELAEVHQVIGWTTLGFMTAAATVWLF